MKREKMQLEVTPLTRAERRQLERRERRHRERLEAEGYQTQAMVDESGCFGIVLVVDPEDGRRGLLLRNGRVRWMDGTPMTPGALADAAITGVMIDGEPL